MARPADELLLAIDFGTQSVRALLFDPAGMPVARVQRPLTRYTAPQPGWMEHDVDGLWDEAALACRALLDAQPQARPRLRGVAVTTQRGTLMPIGRDGRALHPAIVWPDRRRATKLPRIAPWWRAAFMAAGVDGTIRGFQCDAECNWLAEARPEVWQCTHKLLLLSGLLNWKLTGRLADSVGAQVGYLPFDFRRLRWAAPHDWKWQALTLRPEHLPELVPVGATIGTVTPAAAAATGLPAGLPVVAAAADKACELLGAGCVGPARGGLSYGTTATVNVCSERYVEAVPMVPPYPAALPGHHDIEVQVARGFWMARWFIEQFGQPEAERAARLGVAPEALLDELAAAVPPGSMGLTLLPHWSPGIRRPGPDAKGAVIGFGEVHGRAHLYRAILEGLAYALREGAERIVRKTGVPLAELRICGGGSQSDLAMQIGADVFGLPAQRPHTLDAAALGAAIACAVGVGLQRDFPAALQAMTRPGRVFEPRADASARYDALYREVWRPLEGRLAPLHRAIRRLTGYPAPD